MGLTDIPSTDLPGWRLIFTDDFLIDVDLGGFPKAVGSKWQAYPYPWRDSSKHGVYQPAIVSIKAGTLDVHVSTVDGVPQVAALMPRHPKTIYGRYAVRFRFDEMPGYKIAWMLWPNSNYNPDGEIDFPEMNLDSDTVMAFMHFARAHGQAAFSADYVDGWHVCVVEWSPGLVVFRLDGVEVGRTSEHVPTAAMHWVLQTETALGGVPAPSSAVSGHVEVDWVAVWAYDPSAAGPPDPRRLTLIAPAIGVGLITLTSVVSPGVRQVKWVIGEREVGWAGHEPWTHDVDTRKLVNGVHPVWTKALDTAWYDGTRQTIDIRNPLVLVAPPVASGMVTLGIEVYPWFRQVKWVIDGIEVGSTAGPSWTMQWDSRNFADGEHAIYVKALGDVWADGRSTTITVAN